MTKCLFLIFDGSFRVATLEKKVSHGDQPKHVLLVDLETLDDVFTALLKVLFVKVSYCKLTKGLVVVRLLFSDELQVFDGSLLVVADVEQCFSKAKPCRHTVRIDLGCMSEIFGCFFMVSHVS